MQNEKVRIILIDDHQLVRKSLTMLLENNPRFSIIAECETGEEGIEQVLKNKPDIVLVDINMYPLNGFSVTKSICDSNPDIKIIGLSVNNEPKYAHKILEAGAKGYITKTSSLQEINQGILEVLNGNTYICEEIKIKMAETKKDSHYKF